MEETQIKEAITKLKADSKPRKFTQSVELIINLKDLNIKNPDDQVDLFVDLPFSNGKEFKICALVGPELREHAKESCDEMIFVNDFANYKDKKDVKTLADSYDFFIAQATVMPKVAQSFGRVFGPKQKMPNPKAGLVVPPKTNLTPLVERLRRTIRAKAKSHLSVQVQVGRENQSEEEVIKNISAVYNTVIHKLPRETNNVKSVQLKLTMSKPVTI